MSRLRLSANQIKRRHERMCKWKVRFENEALAQAALADAPNWSTPERVANLGLYICTACGFIHIGHTPRWVRTNGPPQQEAGRVPEVNETTRVGGPRFEARR